MDSFIALIRELIELVNVRQRRRKDLFYEFIDPIYLKLGPIVDDYFEIFRSTYELLDKSGHIEWKEPIELMSSLREKTLTSRIEIREFSKALKNKYKDEHIAKFADSVVNFFYSTNVGVGLFDDKNDEVMDKNEKIRTNGFKTRKKLQDEYMGISPRIKEEISIYLRDYNLKLHTWELNKIINEQIDIIEYWLLKKAKWDYEMQFDTDSVTVKTVQLMDFFRLLQKASEDSFSDRLKYKDPKMGSLCLPPVIMVRERSYIKKFIKIVLNNLEGNWKSIALSHAEARIHLLRKI